MTIEKTDEIKVPRDDPHLSDRGCCEMITYVVKITIFFSPNRSHNNRKVTMTVAITAALFE